MEVGHLRGEPLGQRALPPADLERHVGGIEGRIADDRLEQVRVGEEVLAQPDRRPHQRKALAAFASTARSSSS